MWLEENPVIAAVRSGAECERAIQSEVQAIFLLNGNLMTLAEEIAAIHRAEKRVFVHLDLAEGLGKDAVGLQYLQSLGADGVISTRNSIIRAARETGLATVQRFFIVDSHSMDTALDSVRSSLPDYVELMPGVVPKVIARFCAKSSLPVIAGGLIESKEEIIQMLGAGATAVSTGRPELWNE